MMHFRSMVLLLALATIELASLEHGLAADPPAIDASAVDRAVALQKAGQLVAAEKLLREVLAGLDAGKLPSNQTGRCLKSLTKIYRTWGRNDDALVAAQRYRKYIVAQTDMDANIRNHALEENAVDLAEIYSGLQRYTDAERMLHEALDLQPKAGGNPALPLTLEVKLAKLAVAQDNEAESRQRWQTVVEHGAATLKKIEGGQLPGQYLPEVAAALVAGYSSTENYAEAIRVQRALLSSRGKQADKSEEIKTRTELGLLYSQIRDYARAQQLLEEALASQRKLAGTLSEEAELLSALAAVLKAQGAQVEAKQRFDEAAAVYAQAIQRAEKIDTNSQLVASLLQQQQNVLQQAGRFREAIEVNRRLLKLCQQQLGAEHPTTYAVRSDLGALYGAIEDYELAKPLLTDALHYWQQLNPPNPLRLARALNDLGVVQRASGSLNEARSLFEQSLAIRKQRLKPDDLRLAYSLNNLASVYLAKGDNAPAIALLQSAVELYRARGRAADDALSNDLLNLAMAYKSQGQLAKASDYCNQALTVYQRAFGDDAPGAAAHYNALAQLAIAQGKLDEAAKFNGRAVEIQQRHHLDREPVFATTLHHRALIAFQRGKLSAASKDWQQALEIQQAAGQKPQAARTLNYLARLATLQNQLAEAQSRYRQSLTLQELVQTYPVVHYLALCNLAELLHADGKSDEALGLLESAVKVIESPRAGTSGGESERADYFAQFASAFDLLVDWNLEAGKLDAALAFAERGRSRTLLDQLSLAGVDLRESLTGDSGQRLLARETELRTKIGTLRSRALNLPASNDSNQLKTLAAQLDSAQVEYAQVWSDIRNASPLYRQQLAQGAQLGTLSEIRRQLGQSNDLMLFYFLGAKRSYLLAIAPGNEAPRIFPLMISDLLAATMSVQAGPLTRPTAVQLVNQYLADMRDRAGGRGLGGVVTSAKGVEAAEQGTLLAETLLPAAVRAWVGEHGPRGVVIVPDGALHQLPFEALLLSNRPYPRYLLDVFPPIAYAPSATIWMNLAARPATDRNLPPTLLSVGNPHYREPTDAPNRPPTTMLAATRDAYLGLGGHLPPLPGTAQESAQVAQAFGKQQVTQLLADDASEQQVRRAITGQRYIHLAAHGLVDQQNDNLFGAIALTPPNENGDSSENDGFLSLHEIHGLKLSGCELAVLSACQTNVGPERPLEAGTTLAQAFLAAGAKRVVCSHWNVDDLSTAETMGSLFRNVTAAIERGEAVDYAAALADARKKIRANPKWSSPYYWAPFVLVGPSR